MSKSRKIFMFACLLKTLNNCLKKIKFTPVVVNNNVYQHNEYNLGLYGLYFVLPLFGDKQTLQFRETWVSVIVCLNIHLTVCWCNIQIDGMMFVN